MAHHTGIPLAQQRAGLSAARPLGACAPGSPGWTGPARSLYIHVPFCFHKCHYCDFYSIVDTRDRQRPFTDRLVRELRALSPWARGLPLRTIFIGGGTPSLLRPEHWRVVLRELAELFDLGGIRDEHPDSGEFTVECNPETVTPELMSILAGGGVTRVSVGAQSFEAGHLKTLERWHQPENVARAIELSRAAGIGRQSIDLIYAIPGQTMDDWMRDLDRARALGTEHLSCYSLTFEPNTAMTARLNRGEFPRCDEDLEAEMFAETVRVLRASGLDRYEVSNFARPGAECRHNLAYWRQEQWLAAGPSASAHVGGHRWKNIPRLDDYLSMDDQGLAPITDHEPPDPRRALRERIMTGLRLAEGLRTDAVLERAARVSGPAAPDRLNLLARKHASRGHLDNSAGLWRLTDAGFLFADDIAGDFMAAVGP